MDTPEIQAAFDDVFDQAELLPDSADAADWSRELGIPFHEATIEANGHIITLVFSDLTVDPVEPGWAPFVVPGSGPDFKIPLR